MPWQLLNHIGHNDIVLLETAIFHRKLASLKYFCKLITPGLKLNETVAKQTLNVHKKSKFAIRFIKFRCLINGKRSENTMRIISLSDSVLKTTNGNLGRGKENIFLKC